MNVHYETILRAGLTIDLLNKIGFESANESTLYNKLINTSPSGTTAMRDSVAQGINLLLELNKILK